MNTDFTVGVCLIRAVKSIKTVGLNKLRYSGYGIGVYAHWQFYLVIAKCGKNMVIYAAESSSTSHTDNTAEYMLALVEVLPDELDGTTVTVEAKHSVNITKSKKSMLDFTLKCSQNFFVF